MSISIVIDTASIQGQIDRLRSIAREKLPRAARRAFLRIKNVAVVRSRENCPISPTKAQYEATMKKGWQTRRGKLGQTSVSVTKMMGAKSAGAFTRIRYDKNGRVLIGSSKLRSKRVFNPGTLTYSIEGESGDFYAKIFTNQDSAAYADFIHEGTYNRGVGTVAKGPQADRKFIERAVVGLKDEGCDILKDEIEKELATA